MTTNEIATQRRTFPQLSDSDVAENLVNVKAYIERKKADFFASIAQEMLDYEDLEAEAMRRIITNGATQIPNESYVIELAYTSKQEKRIDVLRKLEDTVVPKEELAKALYLTTPEPEWKADLTKLKPIAKKYGGEVAKIIAEGTPKTLTNPRLVITPREHMKQVTDIKKEEA